MDKNEPENDMNKYYFLQSNNQPSKLYRFLERAYNRKFKNNNILNENTKNLKNKINDLPISRYEKDFLPESNILSKGEKLNSDDAPLSNLANNYDVNNPLIFSSEAEEIKKSNFKFKINAREEVNFHQFCNSLNDSKPFDKIQELINFSGKFINQDEIKLSKSMTPKFSPSSSSLIVKERIEILQIYEKELHNCIEDITTYDIVHFAKQDCPNAIQVLVSIGIVFYNLIEMTELANAKYTTNWMIIKSHFKDENAIISKCRKLLKEIYNPYFKKSDLKR